MNGKMNDTLTAGMEAIDILIAPENIRKNLKSENDIYKL